MTLKKAQAGQKWHSLESSATEDLNPLSAATAISTNTPLKSTITDKPPAYPTSSKNGPKNWDTLITTAPAKPSSTSLSPSNPQSQSTTSTTPSSKETEPEADDSTVLDEADLDDDASGDPANAFFRKLYKGADPDTRRAMTKSFQESNGTTLSTNWGDIGKETTKTVPPEGMVAREWDK
jgi:suppressor of G2 allele of SKP1